MWKILLYDRWKERIQEGTRFCLFQDVFRGEIGMLPLSNTWNESEKQDYWLGLVVIGNIQNWNYLKMLFISLKAKEKYFN